MVNTDQINDLEARVAKLAESIDIEQREIDLRNEQERTEEPTFWDNPDKSQQIVMKTKSCENKLEKYRQMTASWDDLMTICEMAAEEDDDSMLDELEHSYAVTVHKSQGSEYPIVILPIARCAPMLRTRNLLYTAVTRAARMVILVGRRDVLAEMVENERHSLRYTNLKQFIRRECGL